MKTIKVTDKIIRKLELYLQSQENDDTKPNKRPVRSPRK